MTQEQASTPAQDDGESRQRFPFREFAPRLYRVLLRRLGAEADAADLVQETYLRFLRVDRSRVIEKPEAYLFRIASNLVRELALHRYREPTLVDDDDSDMPGLHDTGFETRMEFRMELKRLETALEDIPPLYGRILLMSKRDGYTREEIADALGLSPHTVKKYLTRAIAACRIRLSEMEP